VVEPGYLLQTRGRGALRTMLCFGGIFLVVTVSDVPRNHLIKTPKMTLVILALVTEVRKAKDALSAKFRYDITAILRDVQKRERASGRKLVSFVQTNAKTNR
jgi:hypothetical protein